MRFQLIPDDCPKLALRLRRQLMGLLSYLMFLLPLLYAVQHGWMHIGYHGLAVFSAVALSVNIAFFVAIRSGWSERCSTRRSRASWPPS